MIYLGLGLLVILAVAVIVIMYWESNPEIDFRSPKHRGYVDEGLFVKYKEGHEPPGWLVFSPSSCPKCNSEIEMCAYSGDLQNNEWYRPCSNKKCDYKCYHSVTVKDI